MTPERVQLLIVRDTIAGLPAAEAEACFELVSHIRAQIRCAGDVGLLAMALIGAEMQEEALLK